MDTKQLDTLRLVSIMDLSGALPGSVTLQAAAELRRQHAEIETLRASYDAALDEIASLQARVQELGKAARDVNSRRVQELEAQLEAVGAGGVEPLRKRECLHQISEPAQPKFSTRDDAERLKSVARGMSYNDIGEAVWKYTLLEIAMRLETGGYVAPQPAALAQAAAPDMTDAYAGAREDLSIWKKRALEAEALNRKFAASVNGPTFMGEPSAQAAPVDATVRQDAARYRFLRDGIWRRTDLESVIRLQLNTLWDSKIDAAIDAQKGEKS